MTACIDAPPAAPSFFDSSTKFESGTGWPSFWQPVVSNAVTLIEDRTHGMSRTEVRCRRCGSHLGHVFNDGPRPSGLRFCMNSSQALDLEPGPAKTPVAGEPAADQPSA